MKRKHNKIRMDEKYRVCLGRFLSEEERNQFCSFVIYRDPDGRIILDPLVEISAIDRLQTKKELVI